MEHSTWRLALPLLAVAVVAGVFWGSRAPQPLPLPLPSPPTVTGDDGVNAGSITVHVSGWVAAPGLYQLAAASRVADAVAAAGGLLPGADTTSVNLAAPIADGEQVVIPGPAGAASGASVKPGDRGDGKVHLNRATAEDLETLPGVGPVLAERIVEYREQHGPFTTVEDLLDVPGIGEAKLAVLRDQVVVP